MVDVSLAIPPTAPTTATADKMQGKIKISKDAQKNIISYSRGLLTVHKRNTDLFNKMETIDQAYARYNSNKNRGVGTDGVDGSVGCDIFGQDDVTPPIVVSQVDSVVAYLGEVYLSGSPIFPVVSNPAKIKWAEQLETLLDDHSRLGGYPRQLLLFFRDAAKYNYSAVECSWEMIQQFSILDDVGAQDGKVLKKTAKYFNAIKRLDPYNIVRDPDVAPGDIARDGDYAGYIDNISYIKMKRMLQRLGAGEGTTVYNFAEALNSNIQTVYSQSGSGNYRQPPKVSEYLEPNRKDNNTVDWEAYMNGGGVSNEKMNKSAGKRFEVFKFYARIIPSELGISVPQMNTPQIWKFITVNDQYVVFAERIVSAYDYIPIFFGQPLEDGLDYQTQSIAEGEIPFQEGAAKLFNIRFSAARRAVADRALYLADMIAPSDVNAKVSAAKIPVNIPAMSNKTLDQAYKQIPFDMRGTETTINDAQQMVMFSQQLHGINNARQGQFQKGNKSVTEWNDTMGASDGRTRLLALTLEYQVFCPMKDFMLLNIYQYGDNAEIVSQRTGNTVSIDVDALRKQVLSFRMADGYTPKSKMASTDAITLGLQTISASPMLQQAYGIMLPSMFAHLMQLAGVRGLDEYNPQVAAQVNAQGDPAMMQNLQTAGLQAPPATAPVDPALASQMQPPADTTQNINVRQPGVGPQPASI